jgi:hypothetical protein
MDGWGGSEDAPYKSDGAGLKDPPCKSDEAGLKRPALQVSCASAA